MSLTSGLIIFARDETECDTVRGSDERAKCSLGLTRFGGRFSYVV